MAKLEQANVDLQFAEVNISSELSHGSWGIINRQLSDSSDLSHQKLAATLRDRLKSLRERQLEQYKTVGEKLSEIGVKIVHGELKISESYDEVTDVLTELCDEDQEALRSALGLDTGAKIHPFDTSHSDDGEDATVDNES